MGFIKEYTPAMNEDILGQIDHLRTTLRTDLDVRDIGLPDSAMQQLEDQISQASVVAVDSLREIGGSRRKPSLLRRILGFRRPRMQQFRPFDKGDWRERLDSLLGQLSLVIAGTTDLPLWITEKQLEAIGSNLRNCTSIILESRASQAAFPFSVEAASEQMIVMVGELSTQPQTGYASQGELSDQITVAMYIDGDDEATNNVIAHADKLAEALGYGEPVDEHIERGSIFRRTQLLFGEAFLRTTFEIGESKPRGRSNN
jgi:hypothetical protein